MKTTITLTLFFVLSISLYAQSDSAKEEAREIGAAAIQEMDKGAYEKSIRMLKKAEKLDPDNYVYPYEIAYAYYLQKDAKNAIKILKKVLKYENISDECYTMLGNIYDLDGKGEKALDTYRAGLEKYPGSGRLYYEMGIVLEGKKDYDGALNSWEKGIAVLPEYASNYHTAAVYYCKYTTERIWGVLYGELFMNLERGSKKTEEISQLLFETYKSAFKKESETEFSVSFSKNMQMSLPAEGEKMTLPFSMPFEITLLLAATPELTEGELNLQSLHKIRTSFIENWYKENKDESYPNILFDWQKKLIDLGYFESYNYWLLMKGDSEEFEAWFEENEDAFTAFIEWFKENPMPIDQEHKFHRLQY